jgi:N-acetylmuramoyl-L-alanine amidase
MALSLGNFLKKFGITVKYSRTNNDTDKSISERTTEAKNFNADLLVSVHNNAGGGNGFEIIHTIFEDSSIGDDVAKFIVNAVENFSTQNFRRYISKENSKGRDWYGINRLSGSIPSIITEGAFLDTKDSELIDTIEEQQEFGYVLAVGICLYYGVIKYVKEAPDNKMTKSLDKIIEGLTEIRTQFKTI